MSSATSILDVLGMLDKRVLSFADSQPYYDSGRMVVRFDGKVGDVRIGCAISLEALEDHFEAGSRDPVKIFLASRERIEHEARRKYLAGALEPDGSVLIRTTDL